MSHEIEFLERLQKAQSQGAKKRQFSAEALLDALKWDEDGRVTIVSQDFRSNEVLGVAFANREALALTLQTGLLHYYSRSRKKLWLKGEESGHFQHLLELRVDCDGDAILARVRQIKGNCHLGYRSCFSYRFRKSKQGFKADIVAKKVFDPAKVYKNNSR